MKTILFHGPSGSGKDTQLDLLAEKIQFERIGTGDMFRRMYEEKDPDAIEAYNFWSQGKFVESHLTYKMLEKWVKQYDKDSNWYFVSVVRNPDQIKPFDELLAKYDRKLDTFVHFTLSESVAIERMSLRTMCKICGTTYHSLYKPEKVKGVCDKDGGELIVRDDDKPEQIKKRLSEYNKTIQPILREYSERGLLIDIDASPSIELIHEKLISELKERGLI